VTESDLARLMADRDLLRRVLEWYADEANWHSPALLDKGARARMILEVVGEGPCRW
jgi:hypothetical protein